MNKSTNSRINPSSMFVFLVPTRYSSYTEVYNVIQCKMSHTCQCSLPIKPGKAGGVQVV